MKFNSSPLGFSKSHLLGLVLGGRVILRKQSQLVSDRQANGRSHEGQLWSDPLRTHLWLTQGIEGLKVGPHVNIWLMHFPVVGKPENTLSFACLDQRWKLLYVRSSSKPVSYLNSVSLQIQLKTCHQNNDSYCTDNTQAEGAMTMYKAWHKISSSSESWQFLNYKASINIKLLTSTRIQKRPQALWQRDVEVVVQRRDRGWEDTLGEIMSYAQAHEKKQEDKALRNVAIEGSAVLKIAKHCQESQPSLVTGQLLGLEMGSRLEITDCFPFPVSLDSILEYSC